MSISLNEIQKIKERSEDQSWIDYITLRLEKEFKIKYNYEREIFLKQIIKDFIEEEYIKYVNNNNPK